MTFDASISATWGEALADLRDKVGGMTNWSIKDDPTGGAVELAEGDYFVLTTPNGEDYRVEVGSNVYGAGIRWQHGPNWDTANTTWGDRYPGDPSLGTDGYNDKLYYMPVADGEYGLSVSDAGTYWLEYVDGMGFGFYYQREAGDGKDGDIALGCSQLTKTWDYTTANNRESEYATMIHGYWYDRDYNNSYHRRWTNCMGETSGEAGSRTREGYGIVNPDANYSNYPWHDHIVTSDQYRNSDNVDAVIGEHDLFLHDESGDDSAHQDTVQDSGGTNVYTLLKRNHVEIAMGMN